MNIQRRAALPIIGTALVTSIAGFYLLSGPAESKPAIHIYKTP